MHQEKEVRWTLPIGVDRCTMGVNRILNHCRSCLEYELDSPEHVLVPNQSTLMLVEITVRSQAEFHEHVPVVVVFATRQ